MSKEDKESGKDGSSVRELPAPQELNPALGAGCDGDVSI